MRQLYIFMILVCMIMVLGVNCLADSGGDEDKSKLLLSLSASVDYNYFSEILKEKSTGNTVDVSFQAIQGFTFDLKAIFGKLDSMFCEGYISIPYNLVLSNNDQFLIDGFIVGGFSVGKSFIIVKSNGDAGLFMPSIGIDYFNFGLKSINGVESFGDTKDGISLNLVYFEEKFNVKLSIINYSGRFAYAKLFSTQEALDEAQKYYEPIGNSYSIKLSYGFNL